MVLHKEITLDHSNANLLSIINEAYSLYPWYLMVSSIGHTFVEIIFSPLSLSTICPN